AWDVTTTKIAIGIVKAVNQLPQEQNTNFVAYATLGATISADGQTTDCKARLDLLNKELSVLEELEDVGGEARIGLETALRMMMSAFSKLTGGRMKGMEQAEPNDTGFHVLPECRDLALKMAKKVLWKSKLASSCGASKFRSTFTEPNCVTIDRSTVASSVVEESIGEDDGAPMTTTQTQKLLQFDALQQRQIAAKKADLIEQQQLLEKQLKEQVQLRLAKRREEDGKVL
ncbi:hypothetical protein PFISCL1PPCAC_17052, partial [Pristionchus fissidentatus]